MTNEGTFPKINGDILYASEVNVFNAKKIGYIDQNTNSTSGTNYLDIGGSIVYYGTNIGSRIISFFDIRTHAFANVIDGAKRADYQLVISGTAGFNNLVIVGPKSFNAVGNIKSASKILTSGEIVASGGNIGSNYVFFNQGQGSDANTITVSDFLILGY